MLVVSDDFELVPCPLCGSGHHTTAMEGGNPVLEATRGQTFRIVRCDECGLHFTNPRPRMETLGKYYPSDYHAYQVEADSADRQRGVEQLVLREAFGSPSVRPGSVGSLVAKTVQVFRSPESFGFGVRWRGRGRLLDFGCGQGKFLRRMHGLGWDVTGIDFSEMAVNQVRASGLKAVHGTLPHPELPARSFDVVTLRHALEHVPDPRATLRHAWDLLDAGGLLLIAVPNYAAWEVERFGDLAMGVDLPRHLTHFTPATLEELMRREGLTDIRVRQKSRAGWIRKAAKRARRGGPFVWSPASRVAALIAQVRGRGSELIATAEKR